MRVSRHAVDTDAQPWEALSDVLQRKVLNGDPDGGPHTLLLRSAPREPGPAFAQYHPIDEELFGLDGDFTFDGSTWFGNGSYAFYPAYFVHGARVHVRGGYTVYLRLSGVSELFTVDEPVSDVPYFVGEGESVATAVQQADALSTAGAPGGAQVLRRDAATGAGSVLLAAAAGDVIALEAPGLLELFALSGNFALADGSALPVHGYHCEVGVPAAVALSCTAAGTLMISHDGTLRLRQ